MDIIFNPPDNPENKYIGLITAELRKQGYRVHGLDGFFSSLRHFRSIKLVHLNWFENIDDRNFRVALRSFLRKMVVLAAIRLSGKKLVWTMHNRVSHEKRWNFFSRTITQILIRRAGAIVIHSHMSRELLRQASPRAAAKAVYIPHPHYINSYPAALPDKLPANEGLQLKLLFPGMIKPYKNIELLIDVVKNIGSGIVLTIAGEPVNESYRQKIMEQARAADNIRLRLRFIPDDEIAALFAACDAVVLPYDISSSLNSGTAILAFSCKKTVISPEIGTITDLFPEKKEQFMFPYRYTSVSTHKQALQQQIEKATVIHRRDPEALAQMGQALYDHMEKAHNRAYTGRLLGAVYQDLLMGRTT